MNLNEELQKAIRNLRAVHVRNNKLFDYSYYDTAEYIQLFLPNLTFTLRNGKYTFCTVTREIHLQIIDNCMIVNDRLRGEEYEQVTHVQNKLVIDACIFRYKNNTPQVVYRFVDHQLNKIIFTPTYIIFNKIIVYYKYGNLEI